MYSSKWSRFFWCFFFLTLGNILATGISDQNWGWCLTTGASQFVAMLLYVGLWQD